MFDKNLAVSSLWISASAGTGKTKSLIDRILLLLLNGVSPSKILCLTYTKAAASEMLIRLSNELRKMSTMPDDELKVHLKLLGVDESASVIARSLHEKSAGISWVSIQTIHSFCFRLLERFPLETGLLPGIKLCDNYRWKQFIDESIRCALINGHASLKIVAEYTLDIFNLIKDNAMEISHFIDKTGNFREVYSAFFNVNPCWIDLSNEEIDLLLFDEIFLNNHRKIFADLAEVLSCGQVTDVKNAEILRKNSLKPSSNFVIVFLTKDGDIRKKMCTKKIDTDGFSERMYAIAQKAFDFLDAKKRVTSAKVNVAFFEVMSEIIDKFQELKALNHYLDFNDIILRAIDLLQNIDWVMYKIDSRIDHILIDEAQDTSSKQWEVIKIITEDFFSNYQSNRTIFVVGDEKQSIYSFQGADVKLFREMHDYFSENVRKCGQNFYDVPLNKSYRTTGNILAFVDEIFAEKFPGISHSTNRNPHTGVVKIIDLFEDDENESAGRKMSRYIADFIKRTIDNGIWVESRQRPAVEEDFLILFQRRNVKTMQHIINELKKEKIPVSGIDKILLNEELIVEDLIALAEFAVFPLDDLMCARVLKSPIVGISENDLMNICVNRKDEYLWNYICENYENLKNYVDMALHLSAYDFFMYALTDEIRKKFISRLGDQCIDTLHEFLNVVMNYERENTASLQSFLKWFRSFDHEVKRESFADKNAVRLMTVHASKGLQSPFVILADAHFIKNGTDKVLKTDTGLLLWDFSNDHRPKKIEELCAKQQESDDAEFYRLLYVAITRAEDFLYILGEKREKELSEKCWYKFVQET
ncbi:MAG: UvrD-helicase domain-containing protein [Holosporaceae bacterium]|jgi:ATP-dependent helicase/nuclease subunit A|nr:UvrD-helicase domain-containing protein [Holosporaceae bacterium]